MLLLLSLCGSVDVAFVSLLCPFRTVFKLLMFQSAVVTCCISFDGRRSTAFVALCHLLNFFPWATLNCLLFPSPRLLHSVVHFGNSVQYSHQPINVLCTCWHDKSNFYSFFNPNHVRRSFKSIACGKVKENLGMHESRSHFTNTHAARIFRTVSYSKTNHALHNKENLLGLSMRKCCHLFSNCSLDAFFKFIFPSELRRYRLAIVRVLEYPSSFASRLCTRIVDRGRLKRDLLLF